MKVVDNICSFIKNRRLWLLAILLCLSALNRPIIAAELNVNNINALADLMERARQAMIEAQYERAIKTYTELVDLPDHAYRQDALELLGLAYERSGQFDKAKEEYQRFIQLYPQANGIERVKQRLAGITTATWETPEKLRETSENAEKKQAEWQVYGSFSQYVRRDVSKFENQPQVLNQFGLTSFLDTTVRRRSDGLDLKSRVSGSYFHDLDGRLRNDRQLSYLYIDAYQRGRGWNFGIGRKTAYEGGILGRYDGINIGKRFGEQFTLNLVAGMPVEKTTDLFLNDNRTFYGVNVNTGTWGDYWESKAYYIQQQADGMLDRRAVGGELRYLHPDITLFTLLDYDIAFNSLNIFSTQGSWVRGNTTYSYLLDYRNAPPLTTSNALIGQSTKKLSELNKTYSKSEIENLAVDRTARAKLGMLGVSQQLSENYRLDADITATNLSSTTASGGVNGSEGTGTEYFFSTQLTARNLMVSRDYNIIGIRLAKANTYDATTLLLNGRYPIGTRWNINPRLAFTQQKYDNNDSQETLSPGLRFDYRWSRLTIIEFDAGYNDTTRKVWFGTQNYHNYYVDIGYRADF